MVNCGDVDLAVHELGDGPPIILVHGFPELAFSWRHQIPALAAAGYHVIAPDMRGYGGSDKPAHVTDYTIQKLTGDLTGLMDSMGIEKALIVGHDWGALVTWQMALLAPDRMAGLVALNIPFFKRPPINPITFMRYKLGKDFYIVNFQKSDEADRRFAEDPGRFIDAMMRRRLRKKVPDLFSDQDSPKKSIATEKENRSGTFLRGTFLRKRRPLSLLEMLDREDPGGEILLTPDELKYYADAFAAGGFTGPINWYRNWTHNWKSTKRIDQTVRIPSLFVGATDDAIVSAKQIEAMKSSVPDLEVRMIDDCGHWTQQEKPQELNEILLDWLGRNYAS